ncbi:MAG: peptide chain release factor-like protein [Verrucomicrobiota bacterium]
MIKGPPKLLIRRMEALGIREEDLEEQFDRSSGPGGQNVNKVATSVLLQHIPTGEHVRAESSRYQQINRLEARERLCDRIETRHKRAELANAQAQRRKRLQRQGRPRKVKEKILKNKKHRSQIKQQRNYRPD